MPLTREERDWLVKAQADILVSAAKTMIYRSALLAFEDSPLPWWRVLARIKRRTEYTRAARKAALHAASVETDAQALDTYCRIHSITTGESRGPLMSMPYGTGPY